MIKSLFITILVFSAWTCMGQNAKSSVAISEIPFQDRPHFKVQTSSAIWLISRESGGCSSLTDTEGNDWIKHSRTGKNKPTNSADSDFRGLPNLVFRGSDNGVGHPEAAGICSTVQTGKNRIEVTSNSSLWKFSWTFVDDCAVISVDKADTTRAYWFLYEGPVAGKFNPNSHYWATDLDGIRYDKPSYPKEKITGNWQWACFGDTSVNRCLLVSKTQKDTLPDVFGYMGNLSSKGIDSGDGMTVFGFGRSADTRPLLTGKNTFIVGFYERKIAGIKDYPKIAKHISNLTKKNIQID